MKYTTNTPSEKGRFPWVFRPDGSRFVQLLCDREALDAAAELNTLRDALEKIVCFNPSTMREMQSTSSTMREIASRALTGKECATFEVINQYDEDVWPIGKDTIYAAISALEDAIPDTMQLLSEHDAALGRTTRKNEQWALTLEHQIEKAKCALELLKKCGPKI